MGSLQGWVFATGCMRCPLGEGTQREPEALVTPQLSGDKPDEIPGVKHPPVSRVAPTTSPSTCSQEHPAARCGGETQWHGVTQWHGGTQTLTGRPSTPGKPGKPCKEPCQSWWTSMSPPPPSSPAYHPEMLPIPSVGYPAQGTYRGGRRAPKAAGEEGEQDANAPTGAAHWWLVWYHKTFPSSQPVTPAMSPLTGFPSGPASPLSPGRPWSNRWEQSQCWGALGSVPDRGTVWHSPGHRPCPSRQAPLARPVGHPHPVGTGAGS